MFLFKGSIWPYLSEFNVIPDIRKGRVHVHVMAVESEKGAGTESVKLSRGLLCLYLFQYSRALVCWLALCCGGGSVGAHLVKKQNGVLAGACWAGLARCWLASSFSLHMNIRFELPIARPGRPCVTLY